MRWASNVLVRTTSTVRYGLLGFPIGSELGSPRDLKGFGICLRQREPCIHQGLVGHPFVRFCEGA